MSVLALDHDTADGLDHLIRGEQNFGVCCKRTRELPIKEPCCVLLPIPTAIWKMDNCRRRVEHQCFKPSAAFLENSIYRRSVA